MKCILFPVLLICGIALAHGSFAFADFPRYINYQGRLTDDQGDPMSDGEYEIAFQIYNAPVDGDLRWDFGSSMIEVTDGLFSKDLGPIPQYFFSGSELMYLAIIIEGQAIEPRTQLISVPYAFHSLRSDTAFFAYEVYQPANGCIASGYRSCAMGDSAHASHDYSFVWGGGGSTSSMRTGQFRVSASGGVRLDINEGKYFEFLSTGNPERLLVCSNGAYLSADGVWYDAPRRDRVERLQELNRSELINRIESLRITRWGRASGIDEHIGPMSEDFHAAFGVGDQDGIAAMDQAGIALAAIQALIKQNRSMSATIMSLQKRVEKLERATTD